MYILLIKVLRVWFVQEIYEFEAFLYWLSNSEVSTSRSKFDIPIKTKCFRLRSIQFHGIFSKRETSRSTYSRGMEHLQSTETSEERSAMLRHATSSHQTPPNFKMNITGVFRDDTMLQQITEAVDIRNTPSDELLNTKKEWNYVSIPLATITD